MLSRLQVLLAASCCLLFVSFASGASLVQTISSSSANVHVTDPFIVARDFVISQTGNEFDSDLFTSILRDLKLVFEDSDDEESSSDEEITGTSTGVVFPNWLKYSSSISLFQFAKPYGDVQTFLDTIIHLNRDSVIISGFLKELVDTYPVETWEAALTSRLAPSVANCQRTQNLREVIKHGIHLCLVYDGLTRLAFHNPTTFLRDLEDYYEEWLGKINIEGAAAFWNVKFPSVKKPIQEFIKSAKIREEEMATKRVSVSDLEEEEEGQWLERFILRIFKYFIDNDPTIALRQNIKEAAIAEIFIFQKAKLLANHVPDNTFAGAVLMSDKMYGSTTKCTKRCAAAFSEGIFEFYDSKLWMHLYSGWNLAFTVSTGTILPWWSKLVPPAVLETSKGRVEGTEYIVRRAIALYLALHRAGFRLDASPVKTCVEQYDFSNTINFQAKFGRHNRIAAEYYKDNVWVDCPECHKLLEETESSFRKKWKRIIQLVF